MDSTKTYRPRGRPFSGPDDPRRHTGGRRTPVTQAAERMVKERPELIDQMLEAGFAHAANGNVQWATLLIACIDGKPLGREERGTPGEFQRIDLSQFTTEEPKAFIHAVKPPQEPEDRDPVAQIRLAEPCSEASAWTQEDD